MPNLGFPEILLIVTAALLVFGPRKLPELGRSVGQMLREFRRHTSAITDEFKEQVNATPPVMPTVRPTHPSVPEQVQAPHGRA